MSGEQKLYTIVDTASELGITVANVRAYITKFELPTEKQGKKLCISEETLTHMREIAKLRENGLPIKEIYNLLRGLTESPSTDTDHQQSQPSNDEPEQPEPVGQDVRIDSTEPVGEAVSAESADSAEPAEQQPGRDNRRGGRNRHRGRDRSQNQQQQPVTDSAEPQPAESTRLTKDIISSEITTQAKKISRLQSFMSSRNSPREISELKADISRRYTFMVGLRHIRDNWVVKPEHSRPEPVQAAAQ